jgi:energy-coupling factor transporter transmembrane protein EcfT
MAQMTYRFLFILLETLGDMTQAREARQISGYGARGSRAYAGAGSAILFAKSATTANEVQMAIEARGGMARSMHLRDSLWSWVDSAVVVISLSLLTLLIYGAVTHAF